MIRGNEALVAEIVSLASRDKPDEAIRCADVAELQSDCPHPAQLAALRALAYFIASDFDLAAQQGETALHYCDQEASQDPLTRALAVAARLLASAGSRWAGTDPDGDHQRVEELLDLSPALAKLAPSIRPYVTAFVVEALFVNGRIPAAQQCLTMLAPDTDWVTRPPVVAGDVPPLPSLPMLPVRMLFYMGQTAQAEALLKQVIALPEVRDDELWPQLADAMLALCGAARGEQARTRSLTQKVAASFPHPRHYLDSAARMLAAQGLAIIGDIENAAREIRAAGGPGLRRLMIIDRALGFEVLVRDALQRGDNRAATSGARALLELEAHPAVSEISLRVFAQLDLANGSADSALRHCEAALARSQITGALRLAAENELLRCRTLIELGRRNEAVTELQRAVASARSRGDEGDRKAATRQLRTLGLRSNPQRGSGWDGLTEREREVAVLAAQGFDNQAIGDAVFLSPRSVAGILRRVMVAFDVARRSALASAINPERSDGVTRPVAALTRRQREVIDLIADGRTNAEIAAELGISPRTVERHVSTAMESSGATSRTALVHLMLS